MALSLVFSTKRFSAGAEEKTQVLVLMFYAYVHIKETGIVFNICVYLGMHCMRRGSSDLLQHQRTFE